MIFHFPNQEVLHIALTSGLIPEGVQTAPIRSAVDGDGGIWVDTSETVPRGATAELKKLGVSARRSAAVVLNRRQCCWQQLFGLEESALPDLSDKLTVIFQVQARGQLAEVVSEILRLGNDRQSFRYLSDDDDNDTALLRVIGAPYYSLLRALEPKADDTLRAFVEQRPRVWVQLGYQHPQLQLITPPAGMLLFIRSPFDWEFIPEGAFRDVYQILDLRLPAPNVTWHESDLLEKIEVPLSFAYASADDKATLWVLRDDAFEHVERLIREKPQELLERFSFAVGEFNNELTVVLRVRPSKQQPPVMVVKGEAFRVYQQIPNLFIPVSRRLHPTLQRNAVTELLARDRNKITWLFPDGERGFIPESLPDTAFHPLRDWVTYTLDRERQHLDAWMESNRFEFETYVCHEEKKKKPAKADPPLKPQTPRQKASQQKTAKLDLTPAAVELLKTKDDSKFEPEQYQAAPLRDDQIRQQLHELEQQFDASDSTLDSEERQDMWREMGQLNAHLKHRHDTTICWSSVLWEEKTISVSDTDAWLSCERATSPRTDASIEQLGSLLTRKDSQPMAASLVVSLLVNSVVKNEKTELLSSQLDKITQFLRQQERYLPVRTSWLGWHAIFQLSGGDVLGLARARDRCLERLHVQGLAPEFDLASFMRTAGEDDGDRHRNVREHVLKLQQLVSNWIREPALGKNPQTKAYSNMIFAFALAKLGESSEAERLLNSARKALRTDDPGHMWIRDAYEQRVNQVLQGESPSGPFDPILQIELEEMERITKYKVDRLRQHSSILEPHERIDPYRRWHGQYGDELAKRLAVLSDITELPILADELTQLLVEQPQRELTDQVRVLSAYLELSPRLGEAFAVEGIVAVLPLLKSCDDVVVKAQLLERALYIAAHFGRSDSVFAFVQSFEESLPQIVHEYLTIEFVHDRSQKEKVDMIESLFNQSFRGLRKLGMRDEIGRLYGKVHDLVKNRKNQSQGGGNTNKPGLDSARPMRLLLCVAAGWFYFGNDDLGLEITKEVHDLLFKAELSPIEQKNLACAYVTAIGQAPADEALARIEELFKPKKSLKKIEDGMTTISHFSISQIDLIEATVLALVSDDFSLNAETRRWLDEDEFLVRRRIHHDMLAAMNE
ncbi:MAG: hypothetical protein ACI9HK_003641 [Pirellulaceae bacterium]|jgi:hypothetical protein